MLTNAAAAEDSASRVEVETGKRGVNSRLRNIKPVVTFQRLAVVSRNILRSHVMGHILAPSQMEFRRLHNTIISLSVFFLVNEIFDHFNPATLVLGVHLARGSLAKVARTCPAILVGDASSGSSGRAGGTRRILLAEVNSARLNANSSCSVLRLNRAVCRLGRSGRSH